MEKAAAELAAIRKAIAGAGYDPADDTFVPGPGNDTIYDRSGVEGGGNKIFVWNIGDGANTVAAAPHQGIVSCRQEPVKNGRRGQRKLPPICICSSPP